MEEERTKEVLPVNREAKDRFFQVVYRSRERLEQLAEFLLGVQGDTVEIANVRPVLFGSKENDLSFLCNDALYCMMEEQSTLCLNMPYRLLEYITAGLRNTVDAEQCLYGSSRACFPTPKLYMMQVGLAEKQEQLAQSVQYDMRLSESFHTYKDVSGRMIEPDLEAVVHVYDFRMTLAETLEYIERERLAERLKRYQGTSLLDYALVANSLIYIQRVGKDKKYVVPANVIKAAGLFKLLRNRGIFVDLLSNQEVCNMTAATFSRDDMLRYQGEERGQEQATIYGIQNMLEFGVPEEKILQKYSREDLDKALEGMSVGV